MSDAALARLIELYTGLERLGPGDAASTRRALELSGVTAEAPRILDLGCGAGASTLALLEARPGATVVAVDLAGPFLEQLRGRAEAAGCADRLQLVEASMAALPEAARAEPYALVWSEAAAYSMGFDAALDAWRPLVAPGGALVVSELCWRGEAAEAPEAARAFFAEEYPGMRGEAANRAALEAAGYRLKGSFPLPRSAWEAYYGPLAARLDAFERSHADDPAARAVSAATRAEIALFEAHGDAYAYQVYVAVPA